MDRPPRQLKEGIFSEGVGAKILWQGIMIGLLSLTAYWLALRWGRSLEDARTMAFVTMAMSQLVHSFNVRNIKQSLFSIGFFSNRSLVYAFMASSVMLFIVILIPPLRSAFQTALLRPSDWTVVFSLSIVPLVLVETSKALGRVKG